MALVVFLRAVNVGGHQRFKPSELAKSLSDYQVESIGAAGTFLVRGQVSPVTIRAEMLRRLPFEPELMVRSARTLVELVRGGAFGRGPAPKGVKRFVSVLARAPSKRPRLPFERPAAGPWKVRVVSVEDRYALSLYRRLDDRPLYPNAVVEQELGVEATTRGWETLEKVATRLERE